MTRRTLTPYEREQMTVYGPCESCAGPRTAVTSISGKPSDGDFTVTMSLRCLWCGDGLTS